MDGTLADSGQLGFDATLVILERHGHAPISYDEYCQGTKYTTPDRLARHIGLTPENDAKLYAAMGEKLGREFDDLYIDLVSMETAAFYPGIWDLIRRLPDRVSVGALTNAAGEYAHAVLRVNDQDTTTFALYDRFASIRGANEVPRPKPHADGLWQVSREMGLVNISTTNSSGTGSDSSNGNIVYIGDSPSDGMAAQAAGMTAIGVTWGAHSAEALRPHMSYLCHTVEELALLLPQEQQQQQE